MTPEERLTDLERRMSELEAILLPTLDAVTAKVEGVRKDQSDMLQEIKALLQAIKDLRKDDGEEWKS